MLSSRLPTPPLLCWLSFGLVFTSAAQSQPPPRLKYLQAKIQRAVRHTLQAGQVNYLPKTYALAALTVQAYPTYYYEPAGGAARPFKLRPDTTAGYAALYVKGKLVLTAHAGVGGFYAFYPVNPPAAEKDQGLGSRDSTSYDIKLVQLTLPYQSGAFIFMLPPRIAPDLMGFYDQGEVHFVDENGQFYGMVEKLIVAKFGSRAHYLDLLGRTRKRAEEDRKWAEAHHPADYPRPPRSH